MLFSDFLYRSTCCGCSFEFHLQVDAIQMGTHNICLYKEDNKKYTVHDLKTMELLDCALVGVCAVIRSNTVVYGILKMQVHKPNNPLNLVSHVSGLISFIVTQFNSNIIELNIRSTYRQQNGQ